MGVYGVGRLFAIEAKQPGNELTEKQAQFLADLPERNVFCLAPHYMEEVDEFIKKLKRCEASLQSGLGQW